MVSLSTALKRLGSIAVTSLIGANALVSCHREAPVAAATTLTVGAPVDFRFPLPEGASISQEDLAGRYSVVLFLTTYDTISQVLARRLDELLRTRKPRINVLAVALEPPQNAPLVAVYRTTLNLAYPVALADQDTLEGRGPFGDVKAVPAMTLLDRQSRIVYRGFGSDALFDIRAELDRVNTGDL
jgi:hypothetical protein